jgi:hypothetical protein
VSAINVAAGCFNSAVMAEKAGDLRGVLIELTMASSELGFTSSTVRHEDLDGLFEMVSDEILHRCKRLTLVPPNLHEREGT